MRLGKKFWAGTLTIACFGVVLTLFGPEAISGAVAVPSPWLSSSDPVLDKIADIPVTQLPFTNNFGQGCRQQEVIVVPARILPIPQLKQSSTMCVINTKLGALSVNTGYLQRPGSTVAGQLLAVNGGSTKLIPIAGSSTLINLVGSIPVGYYLQFFDNVDQTVSSTTASTNGSVTHKLDFGSGILKDKSGNNVAVAQDSISFSANGDWMVAELPWLGTARVNVKTREILVFGDLMNYSNGLGLGFSTAISPDGKYAVVTSSVPGIFKIYDLSTCIPPNSGLTAKSTCSSKDFWPFLSKTPGFNTAAGIRFKDNYSLAMNIYYSQGGITKYSNQVLTAFGQQPASYQYLGLGDSFASGEGAYQYKAVTDTTDNKCHLSQRSYPYLIGGQLSFGQYESVACSGAKIEDFLRSDVDYGGQVDDGKKLLERNLNEIITSYLPGYVRQKEFTAKYQPKIITLSAGGNDVGFSDKIKRCLDSDTCYSSYEDRLEVVNEVNAQFYRLTDLYTQIKATGDPRAKIYVVGYPDIAYPEGNCAVNVHLNRAELVFAQQLVAYLNSVIKTAAANAGVVYVDVENALAGHRFCETDSWNVAVNGLTAGDDIVNLPLVRGPIGNESYHPNQLGQELLRTKILQQTNNLSQAMPAPDPTAKVPDPVASLPILKADKANRHIRIIQNITGTNAGIIEFGKTWTTEYTGVGLTLKAGSTLRGWLNSTPVDLGTFTPASDGKITLQVTLPSTVPSGFHTLHLYGKNTSEEDIDLYQTVYVTGQSALGECGVLPISGLDIDVDDIDDACDPLIDQAPPPVIVPPPIVPLPVIIPIAPSPPTNNDDQTQNSKPPENNSETVAGNEQVSTPPPADNLVVASSNPPAPIVVTPAANTRRTAIIPSSPQTTASLGPTVLGSSNNSQPTPATPSPTAAKVAETPVLTPKNSTAKTWPLFALAASLALAVPSFLLIKKYSRQ